MHRAPGGSPRRGSSSASGPSEPTFLIIGAAKSGTTTLHNALGEHPEVFVTPVKETNYFALDPSWRRTERFPARTREEYLALFAPGRGRAARGETSPLYLERDGVAERIAAELPGVRLIAILRNPVDRAYSAYRMSLMLKGQPLTPASAFAEAADWLREDSPSVRGGFYARLLRPYLERFPRERLQLVLFDDLVADASGLLRRLYAFLGVDPRFDPPAPAHYNLGGEARVAVLTRLARASRLGPLLRRAFPSMRPLLLRAQSATVAAPPPLPDRVRRRLVGVYRDDVSALEEVLGRDLGHWLDHPPAS